jgi:hypothetical protein
MDIERLKLFKSEEDIKSFAKVNGYGDKGIEKLINEWKAAHVAPTKEVKKGKKKFGILSSNDYSSKD